MARLHDQDGDIGPTRSEHVGEAREQQQTFVCGRIDERHERSRLLGRQHRGPVDGWFDRRAHQSDPVAVMAGQKPAAREGVIDVFEIPRLVVAEAAHGKRGGDPSASRARHRFEDHQMPVAGDQLIGREIVDAFQGGLNLRANLRHGVQRYPQSPARILYCIEIRYDGRIARIPEYGNAREPWDCLLEKLQPFPF